MLRNAFVNGRITLEQFEDAIGEAIQGVWTKTTPLVLPKPGGRFPPQPPPDIEMHA